MVFGSPILMKMDVYAINSPALSTKIADFIVLRPEIFFQKADFIDSATQQLQVPIAATVGFFDGVHRGHQYVLHTLRQLAIQHDLPTVAITFAQHPRSLARHVAPPPALTTLDDKITLLGEAGADAVAVLNFSPEMAQLTAQAFMLHVLKEALGTQVLLMGYDHRFGKPQPGEGFADYLRYATQLGMTLTQGDKQGDALQLSSSSIRLLLEQGNVHEAASLLGRDYELSGTVVHGFQNGRKLGYPTANLQVEGHKLVPHLGSYATWVEWRGERYRGMTNIGRRPTLDNGEAISIETHLLDFKADLYGEKLTLRFVERLRDEKRFEGLEHLKAQLALDAQQASRCLAVSKDAKVSETLQSLNP